MCRRPAPTPPRNLKRTSRFRPHIPHTYSTTLLASHAHISRCAAWVAVCLCACVKDDLVNIRRGYTLEKQIHDGDTDLAVSLSHTVSAPRRWPPHGPPHSAARRAILSHESHSNSLALRFEHARRRPAPSFYITYGVRAVRAVSRSFSLSPSLSLCLIRLICGSRGWARPAALAWCRAGWETRLGAAAGRPPCAGAGTPSASS